MTARLTKSEFAAPRTAAIDITDQVQLAPSAQIGRPSAWLHIDGSSAITAAQKHSMENHQGAPGRRLAAQYSIALAPMLESEADGSAEDRAQRAFALLHGRDANDPAHACEFGFFRSGHLAAQAEAARAACPRTTQLRKIADRGDDVLHAVEGDECNGDSRRQEGGG